MVGYAKSKLTLFTIKFAIKSKRTSMLDQFTTTRYNGWTTKLLSAWMLSHNCSVTQKRFHFPSNNIDFLNACHGNCERFTFFASAIKAIGQDDFWMATLIRHNSRQPSFVCSSNGMSITTIRILNMPFIISHRQTSSVIIRNLHIFAVIEAYTKS